MKTGTLFCIQSTIYHIRVLNTNTNFSLIQKSATKFFYQIWHSSGTMISDLDLYIQSFKNYKNKKDGIEDTLRKKDLWG